MSLEFELQKYPKEIKLKDGSKSRLRPLRKDDEKNFHEFFLAVPEAERMFIKHRVTNAASESLNAKIQWVKYTARGFRNQRNFINAIYFHCGGLDLAP